MSKAVDDILAFLRGEDLTPEAQAELIERLRDGEGEEHKPEGVWLSQLPPTVGRFDAERPGFNVDWVHSTEEPTNQGLSVTFYHGQMDGKPVIQIDGEADFRINVNDCPIWDQSTDTDYKVPEELNERLRFNQRGVLKGVKCAHCGRPHHSSYCEDEAPVKPRPKVWVGTISDADGVWVYVGATEQALFADMRSNYGPVEFREESDHDWVKRASNQAGAIVNYDSYYVEGAE